MDHACTRAFLVDTDWIANKSKNLEHFQNICDPARVVLEWSVTDLPVNLPSYANSSCVNKAPSPDDAGGYVCRCKGEFYEGNPYLPNCCQVVRGCEGCVQDCISLGNHTFGCPQKPEKVNTTTIAVGLGLGISIVLVLALVGVYWLYHVHKRRRNNRIKAKNFERNGGLLLKQQMSSEDNNVEKTRILTSDELEKATDQYNVNRIVGEGGQGTVYKGMLNDGKLVAIKKSKKVDESQLNVFINELEDFPITWEMRLHIATDIANALAYLHSSYLIPIFHRDIKSSNILLDNKYRAKLSDFGISKSVGVDQTHITTRVVGTFGYLDPGYFQSNQFTDKSDVYSFGVVLVELLSGQKANRVIDDEERGLVVWFLEHMGDSSLYDILDARVKREGREEEIMLVAQLAKRCVNLDGKRRPAMKEVAAELETIRSSLQHGLSKNQSISNNEQDDAQTIYSSIDMSLDDTIEEQHLFSRFH
uniref:Protein kinase domain-containing protein n=1 Tax=Chenopodium quinoa TaxID=63459 RepID=A0A803MPU3_CHEQI